MNSSTGGSLRGPQLPREAPALAAVLPDVPRWLETRSLLLSGRASTWIADDSAAAVVVDTTLPLGALVGRAERELLRDLLARVPEGFELIAQMDSLDRARQALPEWAVTRAVVHTLARPYPSGEYADSDVIVSAPPDARWLTGLPDDVRHSAGLAEAIAVRVVNGTVVAVCAAGHVTETLWDVGIDTLHGQRRRGYAASCFYALAGWMAERGRQPVWAAYEDYPPSLTLAEKLGFRPVDQVAVLSPPPSSVP